MSEELREAIIDALPGFHRDTARVVADRLLTGPLAEVVRERDDLAAEVAAINSVLRGQL